jgi:alanine racemase
LKYTISNIAQITGGELIQFTIDNEIEHLLLDSRKLNYPQKSIFFAFSNDTRSGLLFIDELYQNGVTNFIVGNDFLMNNLSKFPFANFLKVGNVLSALQQLAIYHRNQFHLPVIGITGSNGKTIIKEWLNQLLQDDYHIVRSPKSYNSQIGVPLSVWQIKKENNLGIFEAGISLPKEMEKLQPIINPSIGILNYMGDAHAEGFENTAHKINEKLQLFQSSKVLIYCNDNNVVEREINRFFNNQNHQIELFSWGKNNSSTLKITNIFKSAANTLIDVIYKEKQFQFSIPFNDDASVYNAITCFATLVYLGISTEKTIEKMKELLPLEMRLELKQGINQCTIINDSYSADIDSLKIALNFLHQQELYKKKTIVISDFSQTGLNQEALYHQIAELVSQKNIKHFVGIGPELYSHQHLFRDYNQKKFYKCTADFIIDFDPNKYDHETILLKGTRFFEFEKISKLLEFKLHDTLLEINLNALKKNLKTYRSYLQKEVKIMAMVKAFSYGSGTYEIARLLENEGVEYLAVAYTDEGVELKKAGVRLPIMVMNATEIGFDNILKYALEPEMYSFKILAAFAQYLNRLEIKSFPIHLKLDTGMHRLGFMEHEIPQLCAFINKSDCFTIKSVFSHLVSSENPQEDNFTAQQGKMFSAMTTLISEKCHQNFLKHLANTSAIYRHQNLQFDMVRLGIGLYGVDANLPLEPVTTLKTTIAQIKKLNKGETVGYGRAGVLTKDSVIATVRIGYADGYPRILSNGKGKMLVNGSLAPVIGNVCMDMTMLDITGIEASENDEVIVFGNRPTVTELAHWSNTISYEILTNISQRVKRVYYEE